MCLRGFLPTQVPHKHAIRVNLSELVNGSSMRAQNSEGTGLVQGFGIRFTVGVRVNAHPGVCLDAGVQLADLEEHPEHAAPGDVRVRVVRLQLQVDDLRRTPRWSGGRGQNNHKTCQASLCLQDPTLSLVAAGMHRMAMKCYEDALLTARLPLQSRVWSASLPQTVPV